MDQTTVLVPDPPLPRRDRRWGYVFVGPQLLGMALFVVVPFAASMVLAFGTGTASTT